MSALAFRSRALLDPRTSSGLRPSFAWDFRRGALPPAMTFTRASAGWTWENGQLAQRPTDVPRFWTDPATGVPWGLVVEPQSTNQIAWSQALTAGIWRSSNVTLAEGDQTAPDGTPTAATIRENGITGIHEVETDVSITGGSVYGVSVFVKNINGARWINFGVSGGNWLYFQPSTGTVGGSNGLAGIVVRTLASGWYRLSALYTAPVSTTTSVRLYLSASDAGIGGPPYSGDGSGAIAAWGFQFESSGAGVTSYIPTTGNTVTRSKDIPLMPMASVPGWDAAQGGVLLATFRMHTPAVAWSPVAAAIADASFNNAVALYGDYGTATSADVYSGGARQARPTGSPSSTWIRRRVAAGWSTSRIAVATDGAMGASASGSYALPVNPTHLYPGSWTAVSPINGTIESIAYYKGVHRDAFVQAVSR